MSVPNFVHCGQVIFVLHHASLPAYIHIDSCILNEQVSHLQSEIYYHECEDKISSS